MRSLLLFFFQPISTNDPHIGLVSSRVLICINEKEKRDRKEQDQQRFSKTRSKSRKKLLKKKRWGYPIRLNNREQWLITFIGGGKLKGNTGVMHVILSLYNTKQWQWSHCLPLLAIFMSSVFTLSAVHSTRPLFHTQVKTVLCFGTCLLFWFA